MGKSNHLSDSYLFCQDISPLCFIFQTLFTYSGRLLVNKFNRPTDVVKCEKLKMRKHRQGGRSVETKKRSRITGAF